MSHVGKRFDLKIGCRHLRIVVVGQESGWSKGPRADGGRRLVSLAERYEAIHDVTCLERRCYAESAPWVTLGRPRRMTSARTTASLCSVSRAA
jgi:hypothetical protein